MFALLIAGVGVVLLVAAWLLHWMLLIAGAALVVLGVFLAFGGQIPGL